MYTSLPIPSDPCYADARRVPGFSRYIATPEGRIFSDGPMRQFAKPIWREAKPKADRDGYLRVSVTPDVGAARNMPVHQMVAAAFIGPKADTSLQVSHADGNPLNNRAGNLRYATCQENHHDKWRHGTMPRGSASGTSRLVESQVAEIKRLLATTTLTKRAIGRQFGVNENTIGFIARGRNWKHVPDYEVPRKAG